MYAVALQRRLIARHFLVGGDWGDENRLHSHHYRIDVEVEGPELGPHDFLVDLCDLETALDAIVDDLGETTLNDLPELAGRNPSIELLAHLIWRRLAIALPRGPASHLAVTVWETATARATYRAAL